MRRLLAFLASAGPALLAGAFFGLALARLSEGGGTRVGGLVAGALYGLAVVGMIRLFRVAPWGAWIAGLFAGPVPLALLASADDAPGERGGAWLVFALAGLLIGGLEHARRRADGS